MLFTFVFTLFRSSHRRYFIKKAVLQSFAIFTWNHLCWGLCLIKLQPFRPVTLLERNSSTGQLLRIPILRNICQRLLLFIQKNCWNIRIVSQYICFQRVFEFIKKNVIYKKNFICKEKSGVVKKVRKLRNIISFILEIW